MRVAFLLPLFPELLIRLSVRGRGDFPLGLGYMAAALRREGHESGIFIPDGIRLGMEKVWRDLAEFRPDLLGLSVLTQNVMEAGRVAREAKRRLGCPVIMGGPHPTALPRSTLEGLPELDGVICGEAELSMLELARERGFHRFKMHAQAHLADFYGVHGFTTRGDIFQEANIDHYLMVYEEA